ncbi:MAG: hypothetical protein D6732_23085 [Methanobacteriota archaeon]|nr:MAG: hypothetical protein D6732_23085 [Euryarchaeota archaeon]
MSEDYDHDFGLEEKESGKIKGSLLKGLLFSIIAMLVLEVVVTFALSPDTNMVHRLIAYMLGVLVIFILALFTKSILKMLLGIPLVVAFSFAPPRVLPSIFTDLFGLFVYLSPVVNEMLKVAAANEQLSTQLGDNLTLANQYKDYLFVIDVVVALIAMMIGGIGLTLLVRMFSKKPNVLIIFSIIFTIIFLVIGVIALPYSMTVASGLSQFGGDMALGGAYMSQGFQELQNNFETGNFSLVDDYFANATFWFKDAREVLTSLQGLGINSIVDASAPQYSVLVSEGFNLVDSIVDLANGVGPLVVGFGNLKIGFEKAFSEFGTSALTGLAMAQTEDQFEEGLRYIEIGMQNISDSLDDIKAGVSKMAQIKVDELQASLGDQGIGEQVVLIQEGAKIFNATIDMFAVLINPVEVNGQLSERAALIHLLLGTRELHQAASKIGDKTDFSGTGSFFENVVSNLTIFRNALNDPAFDNFQKLESNTTLISGVKEQVSSSINFLKDASDVAINLGNFGSQIVPVLELTNQSLSIFTDPTKNFTTITDDEYDNSFDSLGQVLNDSIVLNQTAFSLQASLDNMSKNAEDPGYYGLFTQPALQFTSLLASFNVTQNSQNFIYLAHAFRNIILMAKEMKNIQIDVNSIKTDVEVIQSQPDDASKIAELNNRAPNMDANLTDADGRLNDSVVFITNAKGNLTLAFVEGGMTQLSNVDSSMSGIIQDIKDIQGPQGMGKIKTILADPSQYVADNGITQTLTDFNDALTFIESKFDSIQANLAQMSLAS